MASTRSLRIAALPGRNIVAAWSDENGNGLVDAGDYFGAYPVRVTVAEGRETTGITVQVARMVDGVNPAAGDAKLISGIERAFLHDTYIAPY